MKLREIQEIAMGGYEGDVPMATNLIDDDGKPLPWAVLDRVGDTLACFVVLEIADTYQEEEGGGYGTYEQLNEAAGYMESASGQLERAAEALRSAAERFSLEAESDRSDNLDNTAGVSFKP